MFYGHLELWRCLVFPYICQRLYLLWHFACMSVCAIGAIIALLYGYAEYIHTQGMMNQNLEQVYFAFKLFPYDFRFRNGLLQIANSNESILILLEVQKYEPNSIALNIVLANYFKSIGDNVNASKQLKNALDIKRKNL